MASGPAATPKIPSLVGRLVRTALLWIIPFLVLTIFILTWFYRTSTYRIFDDPLESTITSLVASTQVNEDGTVNLAAQPVDPKYQQPLSGRYWLVGQMTEDGLLTPVLASRSLIGETVVLPPSDAAKVISLPGTEIRSSAPGPDVERSEQIRVVARSIIFPDRPDSPFVFLAAADRRSAMEAIRRFTFLATGLLFLLTAGLVAGIYMQVRLGLQPLFVLRDNVVAVREGRAEKVEGEYPREIAPLAGELNTLIDYNRDVVERARTHVSNLAHALKTPLAVLLNESNASKSKLAKIVDRQASNMKNQVDHHLKRARAATRGQVIGVNTLVAETLEPIERTMTRIHRGKDIDLTVNVQKGLKFRGEKRDLEEIAGNLMDNACKWAKSAVSVHAQPDPDDPACLLLTVEDDGTGLSPEHYKHALQRGTRLDEATPGTGFGLAIVDDLARAYKGSLALDRSKLGGLKATVSLPRLYNSLQS